MLNVIQIESDDNGELNEIPGCDVIPIPLRDCIYSGSVFDR